jgi:hypothetical protein
MEYSIYRLYYNLLIFLSSILTRAKRIFSELTFYKIPHFAVCNFLFIAYLYLLFQLISVYGKSNHATRSKVHYFQLHSILLNIHSFYQMGRIQIVHISVRFIFEYTELFCMSHLWERVNSISASCKRVLMLDS